MGGGAAADPLTTAPAKVEVADEVEQASAHAVYRLADMLGIAELKKEAKEAIVDGYTVERVRLALFSSFIVFSAPWLTIVFSSIPLVHRLSTNSSLPSHTSTRRWRKRRWTLRGHIGSVSFLPLSPFPLLPNALTGRESLTGSRQVHPFLPSGRFRRVED
jgi:hypothetical protein